MRLIVGGKYYSTPVGSSVRITNSMSDPVPTCTLNIKDDTSALSVIPYQEILILDDQVIPNPTVNLLQNPALNPYNSNGWTAPILSGAFSLSQNSGGGVSCACTNIGIGETNILYQYTLTGQIIAGQAYTLSAYVQGSNTPTNLIATIEIAWYGPSLVFISQSTFPGPTLDTALHRYSITSTAPAGAAYVQILLNVKGASGTNSGTITFTNAQFEPDWIPTLSYPTPFCGPSQTNCRQLPLGFWIRQYRKFAGFVTNISPNSYHGNARTISISAVGYAWLAGLIIGNDTFSNKTDAQIFTTLLNKYFVSNGTAMCTTTNVITGVTVSSMVLNWDDIRTVDDNLCGLSSFFWTIDYYWNAIYAPPGYLSMPISLLCDNSGPPDMVTTFPAYNFSSQLDATQPGSNIIVLGNGSNAAQVIDPSQVANIAQICGYSLPPTTSWMRKVNDATLNSASDCTQRGIAELIQYDNPRTLATLSTNVELLAGYGISITSSTDGFNQTTLLIQQVTASWLGTDETLTDEWEYQANLGAVFRAATNMISRIYRRTNLNTSAPSLGTPTLALIEQIGIKDSTGTGSLVNNYASVVLADTPIGYYRFAEITGTIADDISGNANQGTIHAGPTLEVATLLTDAADSTDKAITFASASTQYVGVPMSMTPLGAHAWSLECWFNMASIPLTTGNYVVMGWGNLATHQQALLAVKVAAGPVVSFLLTTDGTDLNTGTVSGATTYHMVGTYDGTNLRLYVNGSLVAGPTAATMNLVASFARIGNDSAGNSFNGTLDEPAFYNYALSGAQISAHYAAGT